MSRTKTLTIEEDIARRIQAYEHPPRVALSKKFPLLKKPIIFARHLNRSLRNVTDPRIRYRHSKDYYDCVVARHQSVLRRKLGDSNARLQEQKITNLHQAVKQLNGVIIKPGNIFSLWSIIGRPKYTKGYVDGMLLSNGKVVEGLGGGLCQLSNFLYWILLHAPFETVERYHHSMDVFPDSGRTLPFGSGATILYNFIDLKMKNVSKQPLQLKLWLTDTHLKGQILSPKPIAQKFHVFEKNHLFIKRGKTYFRYNEIFQETKIGGKVMKSKKITTNFAPVLYKVDKAYMRKHDFSLLDYTGK